VGDDLAEAREFKDQLDITQFLWHVGSTAEAGEAPASCGSGDNSMWYTYTPSSNQRVAFDTFESAYNTVLSVWTGASHPLAEVACNDDYDNGDHPTVEQSYVEFDAVAGTKYYIRVAGESNQEGALFLSVRTPTTVAIERDEPDVAATHFAVSAYPNPTNAIATVLIENPDRKDVLVEVFDLLGRQVAVLADDVYSAGLYELEWDTRGVPTGVYFVIARSDSEQATRSVTVMR
jgi:hypothetical protein